MGAPAQSFVNSRKASRKRRFTRLRVGLFPTRSPTANPSRGLEELTGEGWTQATTAG